MRFLIVFVSLFVIHLGFINQVQAQVLDPEVYGSRDNALHQNNNVLYGELGGSGFLLSVNYERKVLQTDQLTVSARIGIGSAIFINAVPLGGLNLCIGNRSKLELGFNAIRTYSFDLFFGGEGRFVLANPLIGYRYEHPDGLLFRITGSPFFQLYDPDDWVDNDFVFPWLGISLGYCF
jgi:hypothetical protein